MEINFFSVTGAITFICCVFATSAAFITLRSKKAVKSNGGEETTASHLINGGDMVEKLTGASMMEQLVPEITTHALSYLDYPSLCRLSMTNSLMRKAANDDNAWKALYHKDSVTPINGWKAYYAATRAIMNVNAEFFKIIKERSVPAMERFWLNADYVKCFHASGEYFTGYNAVIGSWQLAFNWEQNVDVEIRDVKARVMTDSAWVTMKAYLNMGSGNVTNVFEFHNGRWYMVHHHCSVMLIHGGAGQQVVQG
ncbi:F-box protein SKIP8 isoform X2 [Lycium barbarum]|uniref:F-box protein SKIP8 isoform X2 n=1 Tax=Lycium barbarum TaxID=112863 RepID=UPI00293E1462|nr:F-box protein SKIP8 isoform X2 [Lycium barbarum]